MLAWLLVSCLVLSAILFLAGKTYGFSSLIGTAVAGLSEIWYYNNNDVMKFAFVYLLVSLAVLVIVKAAKAGAFSSIDCDIDFD